MWVYLDIHTHYFMLEYTPSLKYIYIYIYIFIYIYIYIYEHMQMFVCICIHTFITKYMYIYIYIWTYVYMCVYICSCIPNSSTMKEARDDCKCKCLLFFMFECKHHYRVAKTHKMPNLYRSFSAKEPYN